MTIGNIEKRIIRSRTILDVALSALGSLAAILLMRGFSDPVPGFIRLVAIWVGAAVILTFLGLVLSGSSDVVARFASLRGYSRLFWALAIKEAGMLILVVIGLIKLPSTALTAVALLSDAIFTAVTLFSPRILVRTVRREERDIKHAMGRLNALVVGTGDDSVTLAEKSEASGAYNVVGYLSDDPEETGKVIGDLVVFYWKSSEDLDALQWLLGGVDCLLFPKGKGGKKDESSSDTDAVSDNDAMSRFEHAIKRGIDVVGSGLLMLIFSPVAALCALAIKLEDGGPAIYRQERLGRGGKPFSIYKFRSMRTDAEAAGAPALYSGEDDPRLTKVGKFLRQHHLDELPQLWNVFRGDMSFIGYRPERQFYIDQIMEVNPRYRYLFQIRPGVTSYATLYNGYTDTLDKMLTRLDLDLYYLRNHSLWFDARLLALTFFRIVGGKKF